MGEGQARHPSHYYYHTCWPRLSSQPGRLSAAEPTIMASCGASAATSAAFITAGCDAHRLTAADGSSAQLDHLLPRAAAAAAARPVPLAAAPCSACCVGGGGGINCASNSSDANWRRSSSIASSAGVESMWRRATCAQKSQHECQRATRLGRLCSSEMTLYCPSCCCTALVCTTTTMEHGSHW